MDINKGDDPGTAQPPPPARFRWTSCAFWLPACLIEGLLVAWIAVGAGEYFAPVLFFPLLVGVVLGAITVGLMRWCQIGNRPTILAGTVLATIVTIAGQHYIGYWDWEAKQQYRKAQQTFPDELKGRMPGFADFMNKGRQIDGPATSGSFRARGPVAWIMWGLDGLLLLAAAVALVLVTSRLPYCDRCRTWYRTTRAGRLDAKAAAGLSEMMNIPAADEPESARYRLLACIGGCSPTALEFSWCDSRRGIVPNRIWLETDERSRVVEKLDAMMEEKAGVE